MSWRLAYNPRDVPILINPQGGVLGGQDWGKVDEDALEVQTAVKRRQIVWPQPPGPEGNPRAVAAQADVDKANGVSA